MSKWQDAFNNQQFLQKVQESLRLFELSKVEELGPEDLASYARLLKTLKMLASRLATLDPELYHPHTWNSFSGWLSNLQNYAISFSQKPNASHLQNANASIDEVLNVLRPIDLLAPSEHIEKVIAASDSFQKKIIEELERIKKKAEATEAEFTSLSKAVTQEKTKLDEVDIGIEQQKGRLDQAIAAYQKQFSEAETFRSHNFVAEIKKFTEDNQKQRKSFEDEFKRFYEEQKGQHTKLFETLKKEGADHTAILKKREEDVDRIFGAIGTAAFAGHFKNAADREQATANWLRWGALASMAAMVGLAGVTFWHSFSNPDIGWHVFLFRFGTFVVFLVPAVYCAQESSKHSEREKQTRKMHMELASIDSYLVLLPEAQRNDIKAKLTEKFFGREESEKKEDVVSKHALFDLVSDIVKNITTNH